MPDWLDALRRDEGFFPPSGCACEVAQRGGTPLHLAALEGHESVIAVLAARGADTEVKDRVSDVVAVHLVKGTKTAR